MHKFTTTPICRVSPSRQLSHGFFRRLIEFYQNSPDGKMSPTWNQMLQSFYSGLMAHLNNGDVGHLMSFLECMYSTPVMCGLDAMNSDVGVRQYFDKECIDTACALGVLPVFSPEQNNANTSLTHDGLISAMESVLGGRLTHTGGGNMELYNIESRTVSLKLMESVRFFEAARRICPDAKSVLEIGAGCGFVGYLFDSLEKETEYHTVDLSIVTVIQAFLLAGALGEDKVCLSGESITSSHRVFLHGLSLPENDFDLALNVNSFPEIPDLSQGDYLNLIHASLPEGGFFLSVNHESDNGNQRRLFSAMQNHLKQFRLFSRTPAWGRPGYTQELWKTI